MTNDESIYKTLIENTESNIFNLDSQISQLETEIETKKQEKQLQEVLLKILERHLELFIEYEIKQLQEYEYLKIEEIKNQPKEECPHTKVRVDFSRHAMCLLCDSDIAFQEIPSNAEIQASVYYDGSYEEEELTYEELKDMYSEKFKSCVHDHVKKIDIEWNGYKYTVKICFYCFEIIEYMSYVCDKAHEYTTRKNLELGV